MSTKEKIVSKSLQIVEMKVMRVAFVSMTGSTHGLLLACITAEGADTEHGEVLREGC